jgi:RNA polymerase sigma factor (sigma-70 family)
MGSSFAQQPGRERTRALLEQIAGGDAALRLRRQVLGWNDGSTVEQVEDAFQEACARAQASCRGQVEGEVYAWLRTTTHHCLGRMRERRDREPLAEQPFEDLDPGVVCAPGVDVMVLEQETRAEVEDVAKLVLDRLSQRQRNVAALHTRGFHRREIAEYLQTSPRAVKRLVEQILATGRAELAELAGHGCDDGHHDVTRLAFGLARPREASRAQLHLATCERCAAMYERLDLWREKVAVLLPIPPAVDAHANVAERVVHTGTDLLSGTPPRGAENPGGVRGHLSSGLAQLREHATGAYTRTLDPTPLAGARPGAVAAAVAGCLAVGGGATYCVHQGATPLTALAGLDKPAQHHKAAKPAPHRAQAAQAAAPPPAVAPTVTTPVQTIQPPPPPPPPPTTTATVAPPAPEDQFEPTSAAASSRTPAATPAAKPAVPAPAPADGPGEFDGP